MKNEIKQNYVSIPFLLLLTDTSAELDAAEEDGESEEDEDCENDEYDV